MNRVMIMNSFVLLGEENKQFIDIGISIIFDLISIYTHMFPKTSVIIVVFVVAVFEFFHIARIEHSLLISFGR